ncbi:hypothetical protein [Actinomyces sp.]|uniref:family 4 glycosyl hydrolase n=1 Tax=Actinomyces sp. TaxID=29317 RepID=UPI0026DC1AF1|nr:hypothetical protein [Actinomyces sp.]MDO4900174.1 hypothetical protein [Actinomyces sp.]
MNHLGWLRSLVVDGQDRLPGLLADDAALDRMEEARIIGFDWVRALGVLPNEYLDAVGEVPCVVDGDGVHSQRVGALAGAELGLVATVKGCEELVIDAALSGDETLA